MYATINPVLGKLSQCVPDDEVYSGSKYVCDGETCIRQAVIAGT